MYTALIRPRQWTLTRPFFILRTERHPHSLVFVVIALIFCIHRIVLGCTTIPPTIQNQQRQPKDFSQFHLKLAVRCKHLSFFATEFASQLTCSNIFRAREHCHIFEEFLQLPNAHIQWRGYTLKLPTLYRRIRFLSS